MTERQDEQATRQRVATGLQRELARLVRQLVYNRLAGYPDTNDAERMAQAPAMRTIASRPGDRSPLYVSRIRETAVDAF